MMEEIMQTGIGEWLRQLTVTMFALLMLGSLSAAHAADEIMPNWLLYGLYEEGGDSRNVATAFVWGIIETTLLENPNLSNCVITPKFLLENSGSDNTTLDIEEWRNKGAVNLIHGLVVAICTANSINPPKTTAGENQ